jgi:hypothetical protein
MMLINRGFFRLTLTALFLIITCQIASTQTQNVSYTNSSEIFPNPERGFFNKIDPPGILPPQWPVPLTASFVQNARANNITMIRMVYHIAEFRDKPLSQALFDRLASDCSVARKGGVKLIIRFVYAWVGANQPDATRDRILSHLEQLRPFFRDNYDVMVYVEAGFIGSWGQWNRSSNNLINNNDLSINDHTRAIFSKIMDVVPKQRMVAVPYVRNKIELFNTTNPTPASEAFTGTNRSRTGHHNDGFLHDYTDFGYYQWSFEERDRNFLSQDCLYVVMGGELAYLGDSNPKDKYINCTNAINEMKRMRWSALNTSSDGSIEVINYWTNNGCISDIRRRLGYRFRLVNSQIPVKVMPGGTFSMSFNVANDGFANPFNSRGVEIILRNRTTKEEWTLVVKQDPRFWQPGSTNNVKITGGIPSQMPVTTYDVFLNLPDPAPTLRKRPEYSIRLANQNVWEPSTGYNSLLANVAISPDAEGDRYTGNDWFVSPNGTTPPPPPVINYSIPLKKDWNLISFPIQPLNTDIASVLSPINGSYSAVYAWNGNEYETYVPGSSSNTLTKIVAGRGYWIFMKDDISLEFRGVAADKTVKLKENWNMVGLNSLTPVLGSQVFSSTGGKVTTIYAFDAETDNYEIVESLEPGRGYWMLSTADTTWTLP